MNKNILYPVIYKHLKYLICVWKCFYYNEKLLYVIWMLKEAFVHHKYLKYLYADNMVPDFCS